MMNKRKYKSQIVSICLILTLAVMSNQVKAQSDLPTNPNIVSVNGGISLTSVLLKTLLNGDSVKYAFTSTPTLVTARRIILLPAFHRLFTPLGKI